MNKHTSKQHPTSTPTVPLAVRSERRQEPDWDRYIAALITLALRRVEDGSDAEEGNG